MTVRMQKPPPAASRDRGLEGGRDSLLAAAPAVGTVAAAGGLARFLILDHFPDQQADDDRQHAADNDSAHTSEPRFHIRLLMV